MSFTRKEENFVCEQCAASVSGDGYTNHCPKCLWSKHVDDEPGDRASHCKGAMEPRGVKVSKNTYRISHRCLSCGCNRVQDAAEEDNIEKLIELSTHSS